jgi:DUF4097 and DUF4098 domain-containing protein YvlB
MKDEITRIMRLVKEGKISPEDAAELIDAFSDSPEREAEPEAAAASGSAGSSATSGQTEQLKEGPKISSPAENPFSALVGAIEGIAKEVSTKVDWKDIASQVSQGVDKGVDAIRKAAEEAKVSQGFKFIFGNPESKTVDMPLHVPEGKTLRVEAHHGIISVMGSEDLGSFKVKATFRAASSEDAKRKASLYTPIIEESEQHIVLRLQEGPDSDIDASIMVAPGTHLDLRSVAGRVSVTGIRGAVRVHSASASVEGSGLRGSLEVETASGNIHLGAVETSLATLETKSGDINLSEVKGALTLRSSSGDINLDRCSGRSLTIESASGDVTLDLDRPITGSLNIRAVSGDVCVGVADGSDAKVSLSAVQGAVTCSLELEDGTESYYKVTGRLGEGSGVVDISTVSGDISLALRDNPTTQAPQEEEPQTPPEPPAPPKPEDDSPSFN